MPGYELDGRQRRDLRLAISRGYNSVLLDQTLRERNLYDNDVAKPVLVQALARYFAPVPDATRFDLGLIAVTKEPANAPPQETSGEHTAE